MVIGTHNIPINMIIAQIRFGITMNELKIPTKSQHDETTNKNNTENTSITPGPNNDFQ